ncbi:DUF4031 domain-containing protein [Stenotrophobium rhamnosiphilum]|uniref:DUF4031 domain-containing protein n=1 Tax=Stenotrophobium rhamnosiphilum TaxID=2029166 RepID=A0A2T5MB75_9GAMM|nr:DUF4031 domain-containing protein [Stenotrophobium rhamnosiphilum]PTU28244.1 DUF4031 domain-containing protein [Stenotrophobium rhamnosiphilum]
MSVYIDDMKESHRRMGVSHMVADTHEELHAMAGKLGVARKCYQGPPKIYYARYDISLEQRTLAFTFGAMKIAVNLMEPICKKARLAGQSQFL